MANADHSGPFLKPQPRSLTKGLKRRAATAALEAAYADVDVRDGGRCWVTGRYTQPGAVDARVRREHHHLKGRNVRPEWVTKPERIITVAAEIHQLITAGLIVVEGTDARTVILFHWHEDVKPHQRTFVIKGRRTMHADED